MISLWWLLKCKSTIYNWDLIKANNATKTSVEKGTKEILARIILWPKKTTTTKSKTSSSQNTKVIKTSRGTKKL